MGSRRGQCGGGAGRSPSLNPTVLPNVAEHFAAHTRLHGFATGHHAARRGEDARAQPREHFRHVLAPEVDASPRTADALDPGDRALAVRCVLEGETERLLYGAWL